MDERKMRVLDAIINSYIHTNQPVGSRTISKEYDLGVSSATIRNEMADLEDLGYLIKPHTSAGRIPSDKAFRYYVDEIINNRSRNAKLDFPVDWSFVKEARTPKETYRRAARLLADTTKLTSYVISPRKQDKKIKFIEILSLAERIYLLLIIGNKGEVSKTIIKAKQSICQKDLSMISNFLNKEFENASAGDLQSRKFILFDEIAEYKNFIGEAIKAIRRFYEDLNSVEVFFDGITNILTYDEYRDLNKAKEFMKFFDDRENLLDIVIDSINDDYEILIGSENNHEIMKSSTLINFSFGSPMGQIGIVGPVRLDYPKLIKIVSGFAQVLTDIIDDI
ncbi:heat-inducible transcriptional repressor HrcA [Peptoniphilus sp. GNH]|nr:transcription repressor HrcA [Clostridiales bacterium KA00134]UHR03014.1 heat-inducible transcriptional repressor HrcA [Peptoniphilus sp. GNH]